MPGNILLLDPPAGELSELAETFRTAAGDGSRVHVVHGVAELLRRLSSGLPPDMVVVDYLLGDGEKAGSEILATIRSTREEVPIVAVAEKGDVRLAAEAVRAGASDFLVRGGQLEERVSTLLAKVRKLLELADRNRLLKEQNRLLLEAEGRRYWIVGESPQILQVVEKIRKVARIPRPVLIVGERGTGKELVARAIHDASANSRGPFVVVNCAAFPDALLESELFGHEKGSFTGAEGLVHGKFEQADGGTLFLDEISHMSLPFQQKILRAVEYGTFNRIGGMAEVRTSARLIAATNTDLCEWIRDGKFLPDLYDRLAFEEIRVPPLRERKGDVEILARWFLEQFVREIPSMGRKHLSQQVLEALRINPFPGNVRELKNLIERAAYHGAGSEITATDVGLLPATETFAPGGELR